MTNEQYLYVSYFSAIALGIVLAVVTAALLRRSHHQAMAASAFKQVGAVLKRAFPAWLILAALLGFASVSYIDCNHHNYAQVVADRKYLFECSRLHASRMLYCLVGALMAYTMMLTVLLCIVPRGQSDRRSENK
ncbi:MAG: hypothetical protein ABSH10_09855 [Phycisphaerae bacterium]